MFHLEHVSKFFKRVQFYCLCLLSINILYPATILLFIPVLIYRQLVKFVVHFSDPQCKEIVSGISACLAGDNPYERPLLSIFPCILLSGKLDRDYVIQQIKKKIVGKNLFPQLRQNIVHKYGYYFWRDVSNFSLENHVRYLNPDFPNSPVTRAYLRTTLYTQLQQLPFDKRYSPWEIIIVPNVFDTNDSSITCALIFRANHCLLDGFSLMNFWSILSAKPWVWATSNSVQSGNECFKRVGTIVKLFLTAAYHAFKFGFFATDKNEFVDKAFRLEKIIYVGRQQNPQQIPGSLLKQIAKRHGVGLSSIIATIAALGVGRFIKRKCRAEAVKLPSKFAMVTVVPIPGHRADQLSNHWTIVRVPINVKDCTDAVEFAKKVQRIYKEMTSSLEPMATYWVLVAMGLLPTCMHLDATRKDQRQTLTFSNFPGPIEPVKLLGCDIKDWFIMGGGRQGSVMGVLPQSLYDKFWLDTAALPTVYQNEDDMDMMHNCMSDVLKELEEK